MTEDPGYRTATPDELDDQDERIARAKGWYWEELAVPGKEDGSEDTGGSGG